MIYLGTTELKEIATTMHGEQDEFSAKVYTDALDGLKDRLGEAKFDEFVDSL